jgi:hypothetical protein
VRRPGRSAYGWLATLSKAVETPDRCRDASLIPVGRPLPGSAGAAATCSSTSRWRGGTDRQTPRGAEASGRVQPMELVSEGRKHIGGEIGEQVNMEGNGEVPDGGHQSIRDHVRAGCR